MCAASFSPRKRSAAMLSPFDALSTYGLSICPGSPVSTIFVPSPERVMMVFTSCGVRFCASSTMMNCCGRLRPRMYVSGSTWICPLSRSSAYARGPLRGRCREEKLEVVEDGLHPGVELLVDVAREKADVAPERHHRPRDEHARVRAVLHGALEARRRARGSVLPVPALPTRVTRRIDSSSRRSSAKLCSLLRGRTPMTPSRGDARAPRSRASRRRSARARCARGCVRSREEQAGVRVQRDGERSRGARRARRGRRRRSLRRRRRSPSCRWSSCVDLDPLVLVGLGDHAERVGADAEVRVHRDEDGRPAAVAARARRRRSAGWPGPSRVWSMALGELEPLARGRRRGAMPPDVERHPFGERAALSRAARRGRARLSARYARAPSPRA